MKTVTSTEMTYNPEGVRDFLFWKHTNYWVLLRRYGDLFFWDDKQSRSLNLLGLVRKVQL